MAKAGRQDAVQDGKNRLETTLSQKMLANTWYERWMEREVKENRKR